MKPSKNQYFPLGIERPDLILGLSGILEDMVSRYITDFPKRCHIEPATVNHGALTFKFVQTKRREKNEKPNH